MPDTGYDIPCGKWQPALPNPTPAYDAPSSMLARASSSDGSSTARTMYRATIRSACSDHKSLMGFDPWYAGLSTGRAGNARSENGSAVYDSMAWLRMSSPLAAATRG